MLHVNAIAGTVVDAIQIGELATTRPAVSNVTVDKSADCCDHKHVHTSAAALPDSSASAALGDVEYHADGVRVCVLTVSDRVPRAKSVNRSAFTVL